MPDTILMTANLPIMTFAVNALLLFAMGFAVIFANRFAHLRSK
jgi:hypothetical protein